MEGERESKERGVGERGGRVRVSKERGEWRDRVEGEGEKEFERECVCVCVCVFVCLCAGVYG